MAESSDRSVFNLSGDGDAVNDSMYLTKSSKFISVTVTVAAANGTF